MTFAIVPASRPMPRVHESGWECKVHERAASLARWSNVRRVSRLRVALARRYANNAGIESPRRTRGRTKNSVYERGRTGGRVLSAGLTRLGREGHNKNSGAGQPVRDADRPTQRRPASLAGAPPRYADRFCHYGTSGGRRQK